MRKVTILITLIIISLLLLGCSPFEYEGLSAEEWFNNYDYQLERYDNLQDEYDNLQDEYEELQDEYDNLQDEYRRFKNCVEEYIYWETWEGYQNIYYDCL